jgi:hypothetical protein
VAAEFDKTRDFVRQERNWDVTADHFESLYDHLLRRRRTCG